MSETLERIADVLERIEERQQHQSLAERTREEECREQERRSRIGADTGEPRQLSIVPVANAIPGLLQNFSRRIPGVAWAEVDDGVVEIACPCGGECRVQITVPRMCDRAAAGDHPETARCPRAYLYDGRDVRVAFSPHPQSTPNPQTPAAS